jgi:osmotically-inducible protein OsmY
MKSNVELQTDVQNALKWEPMLHAAEIGVTAKDGVVSLNGQVDSYVKKTQAEHAAKSVVGVRAIIENIDVNIPNQWTKTDSEIANAVLTGFEYNWSIPNDKIAIKVENGYVTLEGELMWNYQREAAVNLVKNLTGVKGVRNKILIRSEIHNAIEKAEIEKAIKRNWLIDGSDVSVSVDGTTVTLYGRVNSFSQKDEAGRVAWNTPGIWQVKNEIKVEHDFTYSL